MPEPRRPTGRRRVLAVAVGAAVLSACGGGDQEPVSARAPTVVVTYSVLGAVVRELVGDAAHVTVLMPDGIDPHDWEPSARDIEAMHDADLVVANGLGLEERLEGALDEVSAEGVPVFLAGDHVTVRAVGRGVVAKDADDAEDHDADTHDADAHAEDHDHGDGAPDPHLWMDPVSVRDVVHALGPTLEASGIPVRSRVEAVEAGLDTLDEDIRSMVAAVPADRRSLVTGHESLGYFADRYGFTIAGSVTPSVSSQAEASAGALAELRRDIDALDIEVIFTETGASGDLVAAIASDADVTVVRLATHDLPDDGTYRSFMVELARAVVAGLTGSSEAR